ncbi:major facilitator superfamily domain-containing protein [Naematelia encephala]|uniref:Major facilitator superfamily domain-containing protein n=1 Tax=Naematelia encephala TaxID=71784 RepID=A0A1Y2ATW3_9TREE|nr:major facilitator superfamily domain-containing protein [Naematelia encephala]
MTEIAPPETAAHVFTDATDGSRSQAKYNEQKAGVWAKFISWIWDSDYYQKSPEERRFVNKLDWCLLPALALGWWIKNVDQSNLSNAYVSGLKEALHIEGNQYTYMSTIYAAVLAGMQLPANFLIIKVRPSWFLAANEIGWTIFTFAQAGAKSYQAMYGFRFCVALFESFYYPVSFFILGSWYTKPELAKRICLWFVASPAGSAFSGYMQAAIYKTLDGRNGLEGWQWLFIICGIMSLPVGIIIFFFVPDFPENTKAWYFTEKEIELARERVARNGTAIVSSKIRPKAILALFASWKFWLLVPWFTMMAEAIATNNQFGVYLKAYGWSVTMRNVLPATGSIVQLASSIPYCFLSDQLVGFGRMWVMLGVTLLALFSTAVLAFWPASDSLRVVAFMISYAGSSTPMYFAWVAEVCQGSTEQRAFMTGAATALWYCTNAWLPNVIYLQTDGPRFKKGFVTSFVCNIIAVVGLPIIHLLHQRELRQNSRLAVTTINGLEQGGLDSSDDSKEKVLEYPVQHTLDRE